MQGSFFFAFAKFAFTNMKLYIVVKGANYDPSGDVYCDATSADDTYSTVVRNSDSTSVTQVLKGGDMTFSTGTIIIIGIAVICILSDWNKSGKK